MAYNKERMALYNKALNKARQRLQAAHPTEWEQYLAEACTEVGITRTTKAQREAKKKSTLAAEVKQSLTREEILALAEEVSA